MTADTLDLLIVGGGAGGLAAAVHAAADGLRTWVLDRSIAGGSLRDLVRVETVPGFPVGLSGAELADRAAAQAKRFGAEIRSGTEVISLRAQGCTRVVDLADGSSVASRSVLVAPGTDSPELPVPGLRELLGSGVHLGLPEQIPAAVRDRDVVVTGELAGVAEAALRLSRHCRRVLLVTTEARVSSLLPERTVHTLRATRNVSVWPRTEILDVAGVDSLELVTLRDRRTGRIVHRCAAALYLLDLGDPRTSWLSGTLAFDSRGFVRTGTALRTTAGSGPAWPLNRSPCSHEASLPGVFAAGRARAGSPRCTAGSIEDGMAAARQAATYLRGLDDRTGKRPVRPIFSPR